MFDFETERDSTRYERQQKYCDRYKGPKVENPIQDCTPQISDFVDATFLDKIAAQP